MSRLDEAPRWLLAIVLAAHGAVLLGLTFPATRSFAPAQALQVALVAPPAVVPAPARPAEAHPAPAPRRATPKQEPTPVPAAPLPSEAPALEAASSPAPAAAAAAQAAPAATPPAAALQPPRFDAAYLNNPKPPYPPLARRLGEEGQATLRVLVTPEGRPERVELAESAGSPRLDEAALEAVRHWRFVPARQGDIAVAAWVRVPIAFRLENNR